MEVGVSSEKKKENSPVLVLIFGGSIPCVFCLYIHEMKPSAVFHERYIIITTRAQIKLL